MLDKKSKSYFFAGILLALVIILILLSFVFAGQIVTVVNSGTTNITINEDVITTINISVNNTDSVTGANITQVNITISGFTFYANTNGSLFLNGSSSTTSTFTNTSSVLSWENSTTYLINGSVPDSATSVRYFWFNLSRATPGNYNITVTVLNMTGNTSITNISITVNDTTAPSIDYGAGTAANNSNLSQNWIYVNVSVTENVAVSVINFTLRNSTGQVNTTSFNDTTTRAINWTGLIEGTYNYTVSVNDSTGNTNSTATRTIRLDTTSPVITIASPTTAGVYNATSFNFSISGNENLELCKLTLDSWATNRSMTRYNASGFYNNTIEILNGTYTARFWCNDTSSNINNSASVVFSIRNWRFSGYVYDVNGTSLFNATINVTIRNINFNIIGYNGTFTNASGFFNFSVAGDPTWFYQPVIEHFLRNGTKAGNNPVDYVGQSLPAFPFFIMQNGMNTNFYLRNAGTINITAINATGGAGMYTNFQYQVKDTTLGFPIQESWTYVTSAVIRVPRDRNYSIMIYPNNSQPVSFNWNNFSDNSSYVIDRLSVFNATNYTVHKTFNTSVNLITLNGSFFNTSGNSITWDEINIIPFLLEPGNMIYLGDNAAIPYNMSQWNATPYSDTYGLTGSNYTIVVPGPAEGGNYILFATGRNGTKYYGGYRNVTVNYGSGQVNVNFTMYPLLNNTPWSNKNISVNNALNWQPLNISTAQQSFNLVNATNATFGQISAHIEITLDYSNYNAIEFTFMKDISQGSPSTFYLPLINATGIKEINVYSMDYAPKRVSTKTATQISAGKNNVTLTAFNPGDIEGGNFSSNIYISLYKSNSTCDVPSPPSVCSLVDSSNMDTFNPLNAIIGGGKISFRMGLTSNGIEVHYVNVDMMASGPPDALFDDTTTNSTSGTFSSALRFGSEGPRVYDYVLISMPYQEGSSTVAGLNESLDANISIPVFYDENWNVIWNASLNGSNGTALSGNYSHYSRYQSNWEVLMGQNNCTTNLSLFNASNPCFINKTGNRIWVRLPHFSGTGPILSGVVTTVTTSTTTTGGGGGAGGASYWTKTVIVTDEEFAEGYTKELKKKERLRITINDKSHYVGVVDMTKSTITVNISSAPQQATLSVGDARRFDVTEDGYYDLSVKLNSISSDATKADITVKSIKEKVTEETITEEELKEEEAVKEKEREKKPIVEEKKKLTWLWILIAVIVVLILIGVGFKIKRKS